MQGTWESRERVIGYGPGAVSKDITVRDCAAKCTTTPECSAIQYRADKQFCKLIRGKTSQDAEAYATQGEKIAERVQGSRVSIRTWRT